MSSHPSMRRDGCSQRFPSWIGVCSSRRFSTWCSQPLARELAAVASALGRRRSPTTRAAGRYIGSRPRPSTWSGLAPSLSSRKDSALHRLAPVIGISTNWGHSWRPCCQGCCHGMWPHQAHNDENPAFAGLSRCAEEDSNLHPVIPDQALNLVTGVSDAYGPRQNVHLAGVARTIWTHRTPWMLPRMLPAVMPWVACQAARWAAATREVGAAIIAGLGPGGRAPERRRACGGRR
jgi:hypothetical protein